MKNYLGIILLLFLAQAQAQINTPKASPLCKTEQRVGLTDITLSYSRPGVNGRTIFGDLVPYDTYWRLGANENTKLSTSDPMIFGSDTLPAGTYALYAKPGKKEWKLAFYKEFGNWGMPEVWDDKKVALTLSSSVYATALPVENLLITLDQLHNNGAELQIQWDQVMVKFPFILNTKAKVLASIQKTMNGPSANDYHAAAKYYLEEKLDDKSALTWVNQAIALRPEAYWMLRTKSLIQASMGQYSDAIVTAEQCHKLAEADGDAAYVSQCKNSIAEWKKKK